MWTHRLFYIFGLAVSALFYVLYHLWFAWYLLVVLLLLLPFDLIISLPGMLTRRAALAAPFVLEQGGRGSLTVTVLSDRLFPSGAVRLRVCVRHEDRTVYRRITCAGARGSWTALMLDMPRSGLTVFEPHRLTASSLLGFFFIPRPAPRAASVLVLPAPVKPPRAVSLPRAVMLRPKPGGGFSEDHDIRPYRPGDPVNSVHWKLSAKHDALMIREPLTPPPHSRLVHILPWNGPDERDVTLGRLRWVSDWLLGRGLSFYIRLGQRGAVSEIRRQEDLPAFLHMALCGAEAAPTAAVPSRFTWVFRIDATFS